MNTIVLYIKEAGVPERMYGFHLGTEEKTARQLVQERWAFREEPGCTLAQYEYLRLELAGKTFDVYDGKWRNYHGKA